MSVSAPLPSTGPDLRLVAGASPKRPATMNAVTDATMITFSGEPMYPATALQRTALETRVGARLPDCGKRATFDRDARCEVTMAKQGLVDGKELVKRVDFRTRRTYDRIPSGEVDPIDTRDPLGAVRCTAEEILSPASHPRRYPVPNPVQGVYFSIDGGNVRRSIGSNRSRSPFHTSHPKPAPPPHPLPEIRPDRVEDPRTSSITSPSFLEGLRIGFLSIERIFVTIADRSNVWDADQPLLLDPFHPSG